MTSLTTWGYLKNYLSTLKCNEIIRLDSQCQMYKPRGEYKSLAVSKRKLHKSRIYCRDVAMDCMRRFCSVQVFVLLCPPCVKARCVDSALIIYSTCFPGFITGLSCWFDSEQDSLQTEEVKRVQLNTKPKLSGILMQLLLTAQRKQQRQFSTSP